jgi:hypothetical protein
LEFRDDSVLLMPPRVSLPLPLTSRELRRRDRMEDDDDVSRLEVNALYEWESVEKDFGRVGDFTTGTGDFA